MKLALLATIVFSVSYFAGYCQQPKCNPNCSSLSDSDWKIGPTWNSSKVSPCHAQTCYNRHGFVLSYFENECQPSGYENPPYSCPNTQGNLLDGGVITTNGKILQVCDATQGNIVFYELGSSYGTHSAVKGIFGGVTKYISKYGTEGPLVAHDINGSCYHYVTSSTTTHYAYVGMDGDPNITGTGTVTFTAPSVSGATYAWSMHPEGLTFIFNRAQTPIRSF